MKTDDVMVKLIDIMGNMLKLGAKSDENILQIQIGLKENVSITNRNLDYVARRFDDIADRLDKIELKVGITVKQTASIETRLIGTEKQTALIPEIHKFLEDEGIDVAELKLEITKLKRKYESSE